MKIVTLILSLIPAVEKILNNPAVTKLMTSLVGLFTKTEAEKAVDKVKKTVKGRKKATLKRNEAIKNARKSYTKDIEDLINRT